MICPIFRTIDINGWYWIGLFMWFRACIAMPRVELESIANIGRCWCSSKLSLESTTLHSHVAGTLLRIPHRSTIRTSISWWPCVNRWKPGRWAWRARGFMSTWKRPSLWFLVLTWASCGSLGNFPILSVSVEWVRILSCAPKVTPSCTRNAVASLVG